MSEPINTGGPAFPVSEIFDERRGETTQYASEGMTLRDYFAAKAMRLRTFSSGCVEQCAVECYEIADAMIKARAEG